MNFLYPPSLDPIWLFIAYSFVWVNLTVFIVLRVRARDVEQFVLFSFTALLVFIILNFAIIVLYSEGPYDSHVKGRIEVPAGIKTIMVVQGGKKTLIRLEQ